MSLIIEVARIPSSEAYRKDPSIINPALEILAKAKGVQGVFTGIQVEDKTTLYLVVVWESLDAHKAAIENADASSKFREIITQAGSGAPLIYRIPFKPNPIPQLHAPITEFAFFTLLEGKQPEDIRAILAPMVVGQVTIPDGTHGASFGQTVEREDVFCFLIGWDTVEIHEKGKAENEKLKEFISRLADVVHREPRHVPLTEFKL
ncbi:hypothetical protein CERSUDRAFT_85710 [Gelatoporia subvermispora B]|uniref:ABM domain-containing protein n=1 Tax=Ceriporiopsis subvermispora (strain B) TaxID=914234 RepID=M2R957_CERS8|nr:hypothetical protein CERSUDRAFT_85710 [Gelatoporia subvermispora B]